MYRIIIVAILALSSVACSHVTTTRLTNKSYPPLNKDKEVTVIGLENNEPPSATFLGTVRVDDSGFSLNCGYDAAIEKAKTSARESGGNVIKITWHQKPNFISSCHRITANILWVENASDMDTSKKTEDEYVVAASSPNSSLKKKDKKLVGYSRFSLDVSGGWSYMTAPVSDLVPPELEEHIEKLKNNGFNLRTNFMYYFSEFFGLGMKYSYFRTANTTNNVPAIDVTTNQMTFISIRDEINVHYIAPSAVFRYISASKKSHLSVGLSIGYLNYLNNALLGVAPLSFRSGNVGLTYDLTGDIMLNENIALGLGASLFIGILNYYDVSNGITTTRVELNDEERENISRLDLSLILRYYF